MVPLQNLNETYSYRKLQSEIEILTLKQGRIEIFKFDQNGVRFKSILSRSLRFRTDFPSK